MNLLTRIAKRELRKYAEKNIDKLEKIPIREGVKLNFFNSGVLVDLSLIANKTKKIACENARKIVKTLKKE